MINPIVDVAQQRRLKACPIQSVANLAYKKRKDRLKEYTYINRNNNQNEN